MFEIDFLSVGDGAGSGDAIAMRFTRPDVDGQLGDVTIDAGFKSSGEQRRPRRTDLRGRHGRLGHPQPPRRPGRASSWLAMARSATGFR